MGTVNPVVQNRRNSANGEATFCEMVEGEGPLVAVALHHGHAVRAEVNRLLAMHELDRLREEDPYTGLWADMAPTRIMVHRSRFEVDLNRARESAVYREPADAWGLEVWKGPVADEIVACSLAVYDSFYFEIQRICSRLERSFGHFVVLDLHSYNHRRKGPDDPPSDPVDNPELNVGTGTMKKRDTWATLIDRFIQDLRAFDYFGRNLDVRENVKFRGGNLARYIHKTFPENGCVLSIEFKKFFMDEWTGTVDDKQLVTLRAALQSTLPGIMRELKK